VGNPERLEMALGKELQRARGQTVHGFLEKKQRRDVVFIGFHSSQILNMCDICECVEIW
jgi:hypothetical protein